MPEGYNFRAIRPIDIDGVRAFNPSHLVPDEMVERYEFPADGEHAVVQAADLPWPAADDTEPVQSNDVAAAAEPGEDAEGNPLAPVDED